MRDEICRLGLDVLDGRVLNPGHAEVENLRIAAMGHEDVGRLDITMNDALGVRGFKRIGELHTEAERVIEPRGPRTSRSLSTSPLSSSITMNGVSPCSHKS